MDVKALQAQLEAFAAEHDWEPVHSPKNLAMALASEAGALLDLFKWSTEEQSRKAGNTDVKEVASDIIAALALHMIRLTDKVGIDLEEAVQRKLVRLAEKYPVHEAKRAESTPAPTQSRPAEPTSGTPPAADVEASARRTARPSAAKQALAPRETPRPSPAPSVARSAPPAAVSPPAVETVSASRDMPRPSPAPSVARSAPPAAVSPPAVETVTAPPEPAPDRYANLDLEAAKNLVQSLAPRVAGSSSDDPLIRELYDELQTLKRTVYSDAPKPVWVADSLKTIRKMLDEAAEYRFGDDIKAREHLAQIRRILDV